MTKNSRYKAALLESDIQVYECGQMPPSGDLEKAPTLKNWEALVRRRGKEFVLVVKGDVYRHPEFQDGEGIKTSAVQWFDRKNRFIRTENSIYVLSQPAGEREGNDAW
jgi:hypothetical protein